MDRRRILATSLSLLSMACHSTQKKDGLLASSKDSAIGENLPSATPVDTSAAGPVAGTKIDYPSVYCLHVTALNLREDASEEIAAICRDGKPTQLFLEQRIAALNSPPGEFKIRVVSEAYDDKNDTSEFHLIWGLHVPLAPFTVKDRPIAEIVTQSVKTNIVDLKSTLIPRPDDPLDSRGLQFWSYDIEYELQVVSAPEIVVPNYRKTQYNLYQVMSGSEEMALGFEHLTEFDPEHYYIYKNLNFVINDGAGYNDGRGGTVIIGYLHTKFNNQGYAPVSIQAVKEVMQAVISNLSKGLLQ